MTTWRDDNLIANSAATTIRTTSTTTQNQQMSVKILIHLGHSGRLGNPLVNHGNQTCCRLLKLYHLSSKGPLQF